MENKKKHIVCLGGGNAMPKAVLEGLKKYPVKISVICAMLDSGGSAGRLRKDYNIVSPGDIRRSFLALSNVSSDIEKLFNYRFQSGELNGHNFANLLITALELSTKSYEKTFQAVKNLLNVRHEVLPVTLENSTLCAVLENGKTIVGETNIDVPKHNSQLKIRNVYLKPSVKAYPKTIQAIKKADLIIIGPGDVYSSLAQILLVDGVAKTINESKAKKVYICNTFTKNGETNNFSVEEFTNEIEKYLGGKLDFIVYNNKRPSQKRINMVKKEHPELLKVVELMEKKSKDKKFIGADVITNKGFACHDSNKVAKILLKLI